MDKMNKKTENLKDGSEWLDHEDCIVGDEEGLKNLINACQTALDNGEYFGGNLGDYVGVKKLETEWFREPKDSSNTRLINFSMGIVLLFMVGFMVFGLITAIAWLFLNKTHKKSLHRTHLSVTPFAGQKPCQPTFAAYLNHYMQ